MSAISGIANASTSATAPTFLRTRSGGSSRIRAAFTSTPATTSTSSISASSRPKSPAIASLTRSGSAAIENASFESAQAPTAPAASDGSTITARLRRRSGTIASQSRAPTIAATSAPRDWVSSSASTAAPSAG